MKKTRYIMTLLIWVLVISGCIESHDHNSYAPIYDQGDETKIRIVSFNILTTIDAEAIQNGYKKWVDRRDAVFSYLKSTNADMIALQEASPSQYDQIKEYFSDKYSIIDNRGFSTDSILLFKRDRFEDIEHGYWVLESPSELAIRRLAVWGKFEEKETRKQLMVVGVHLDAKDIKLDEAKKLAGFLKENQIYKAPLFLMGDFNSKRGTETYSQFIDIDMKDWLQGDEMPEHFTYPYHEPERRIDQIFLFSEKIKVSNFLNDLTPSDLISDHKPVALDVVLEKS